MADSGLTILEETTKGLTQAGPYPAQWQGSSIQNEKQAWDYRSRRPKVNPTC